MNSNKYFSASLSEKIIKNIQSVAEKETFSFYLYPNKGKDYLLPFAGYIEVVIDNQKIKAWGTGETEDIALGKTLLELVERSAFIFSKTQSFSDMNGKSFTLTEIESNFPKSRHLYSPNTNGLAIHMNHKSAFENALKEAIERHTILKALILRIPPARVNYDYGGYVLPNNLKASYFAWKGPLNHYVVVSRTRFLDGGCYYHFGCSLSLKDAIERSFMESTPAMIFSQSNPNTKPDSSIVPGEVDSFGRYQRFSGDNYWSDFFENVATSTILEIEPQFNLDWIFQSAIALPSFVGANSGLSCVRVISPYLQQLFFDHWNAKYINPLAIGENFELPKTPHIIA